MPAGYWSNSPNFPNTLGAWYPLRVFVAAQQLEVTPEMTLMIFAHLAFEHNVEITATTDPESVFTLVLNRHVSSTRETELGIEAHLDLSLDLTFETSSILSYIHEVGLDTPAELAAQGVTQLEEVREVAVAAGLLVETSTGLQYIGKHNLTADIGTSPESVITPVRTLQIGPTAEWGTSTQSEAIREMWAHGQVDEVGTYTDIELIISTPPFGIIKTNSTSGSGTSYNTLTGFIADSNYPGTQISGGAALEIPAGTAPYSAYVIGSVPHTGGTIPRYGQTRLMRNGSELVTGSQQSSSPGTSFADWNGVVQAGDFFVIHWRGEGNLFNRPSAQAGAFLRVIPHV